MGKLGDVIRRRRTERGWSLEGLARRVNVSKTAIHKIETGRTASPRIDLIVDIALAFGGTSVDAWLIEAELLPPADPNVVWTPELVEIQRILNGLPESGEYGVLREAIQLTLAIAEEASSGGGGNAESGQCGVLREPIQLTLGIGEEASSGGGNEEKGRGSRL